MTGVRLSEEDIKNILIMKQVFPKYCSDNSKVLKFCLKRMAKQFDDIVPTLDLKEGD